MLVELEGDVSLAFAAAEHFLVQQFPLRDVDAPQVEGCRSLLQRHPAARLVNRKITARIPELNNADFQFHSRISAGRRGASSKHRRLYLFEFPVIVEAGDKDVVAFLGG